MVTLKEREKIKEDIEKQFGLADALPLFMLLKEPQLKAIQAGDFSSVPAAITAAGLPWDGITGTETDEKKTGKQTNKPKTGAKSKAAKSTGDEIERVTGDIIPRDLGGDILTESDKDVIQNAILDYITLNIDGSEDESPEKRLKKELRAAPSVWGALCMYIGGAVKRSGMINDNEWIHSHGGRKYKPEKVSALADYFIYLCNQYNAMPFIGDFQAFSGISYEYFNGITGHKDPSQKRALTSLHVELSQKFKQSQERDAARRLGAGMQNPTGSIFILKNLHGWKDEKTVEHTTSAAALPVSDLPKLAELGIKDD